MLIKMGNKKKTDIKVYLKNKSLVKDESVKNLAGKYLEKARHNLSTATILSELNSQDEAKLLLHVPEGYKTDDWIIIASYYSMYSASTALLAKVGYTSNSHNATIIALEHFFVKKELLEQKDIDILKNAMLSNAEIEGLAEAKDNREKAQYKVTEEITHKLAELTMKNAGEFVAKAGIIIES